MNGRESFRSISGQDFRRSFHAGVIREREKNTCPWCGEEIHVDSSICCVCGRITPRTPIKESGTTRKTAPLAFVSLVLSGLSLLILPGLVAIPLGHAALGKIRKDRTRLKGESLVRAGLLIAYVGTGLGLLLLVFYGYPNYLRYRANVREDAAIHSVHVLNIALETYAETYGKGFPESLSKLGPPPPGAPLDSNAAGLVRPSLASGHDSEYTFTYIITSKDAHGHPTAYAINANPARSGGSDGSHFFTDQNQLIRMARFRAASIESPLVVADSDEPLDLH